MQQYLYENSNTNISKFIAKARAKTLELKHINPGNMMTNFVQGAIQEKNLGMKF
jgi:hypothetical protein